MFLAVLLGVLAGCIAGLVPGLHSNLISVLVAGLFFDVWSSVVFITAMAVSRSVVDAVPTVFLGFSSDVLGLFPGHRLLKQGKGVAAVKCCVLGSVLGVVCALLFVPVVIFLFPLLSSFLKPFLFWVLLAFVLFLLSRDLWWSVVVFVLSGFLGFLALNSIRNPLFPLLSGLFGASGLLLSLKNNDVPFQNNSDVRVKWVFPLFSGALAGSFVCLFPGLSPSQAAALSEIKKFSSKQYLVLIGALGTVDVVVSLAAFFAIGKARNGSVVVIENLIGSFSVEVLVSLVVIACISVGLSAVFALFSAGFFARVLDFVDFSVVSIVVLSFLVLMSLWLSGVLGLLVFITACFVGFIAPLTGVSRTHAMGCLLLPTLVFLW